MLKTSDGLIEISPFLDGLTKSSVQAAFVMDCDFQLSHFNEVFLSLTGLSGNLECKEILHPDDFFLFHQLAEKSKREASSFRFCLRFKTLESQFTLFAGEALRLALGSHSYWFISMSKSEANLTHLKDTEELLARTQESEQFLDSLIEHLPILVFVKEAKDLSFVHYNKAGKEITGFTTEQMKGKSAWDFFPKEQADHFAAVDREVLNKKSVVTVDEELILTRHKGLRTLRTKKVPILGSDGDSKYILGISEDITDEKMAREHLELTSQRLNRIIDVTGEGIWERLYHVQEVRYVDNQAKKVFGFGPNEDFSYAHAVARIPEEDQIDLRKAIEAHRLENSSGFSVEFRIFVDADPGRVRWVLSRGRIVYEDGVPVVISTIKDVTDQVIERDLLKKAIETAEAATKAKAEFLANMSHEIRTPLNGVIGMCDLLLETTLDDEQNQFAKIIQQSGAHLLALINDILDFSKIEAGKMRLESLPFSLKALIHSQLDILSPKAKEKNLTMHIEVERGVASDFVGDAGRLGQILLNLLSNAIKFTNHGGILIKIMNSKFDCVRIEIRDTGIGLSDDDQRKLFRPFSQADDSTSRKYGGTGLGLSICKRLVEMMDGRIGVRSALSEGSVFWFEIPLKVSVESRSVDAMNLLSNDRSITKAQRPMRILVADDIQVNQLIVKAMLESWGHSVHLVANGIEAVDALTRFHYDLVLMDCQMPEMDGYEATQKIRASGDARIRDITIIALTANAMAGDRERCVEIGMSDYIAKPIDKKSLAFVIEKWCRNSYAYSS